ncbi:hypothetical protein PWT90_10942 [Aphanocladium album]|nr:hypothetical protein PWT90_10942 [Aphanocladium album]
MPPDAHQRRRARQACTHCNARRVKCNVTEKVPCDNCVAADTQCELRVSRRGKHPRHRPGQAAPASTSSQSDGGQTARPPTHQPPPHKLTARQLPAIQPPPPPPSVGDFNAPNKDGVAFTGTSASPSDQPPSLVSKSEQASPNDDEMSQASMALASLSRGVQRERKPEIESGDRPENGVSVFFGESSSVRYVGTDNFSSTIAKFERMAYQGAAKDGPATFKYNVSPALEALRNQPDGPFTLPPGHVITSLLTAYFQWFHPFCPIVDEQDVWQQLETGSLSTLLLQSLLLIGACHCDESVLSDAQLGSASQVKTRFYSCARQLYEADAETDSIVIIASLILMSFWRGPVTGERDARYWLGIAISTAQRRGLHRSREQGSLGPNARVPDRQKKLARRVWWSVYMHEKQTASTLGLPQRIRDDDCDVEPLEAADFEHAYSASRPQDEKTESIEYTIRMTQLATFLGRVLELVYSPNRKSTEPERSAIRDELVQWKQSLPPSLRIDEDSGFQPSLHSSMVHMAYNNIFILLFRNCFTDFVFDHEGQYALQAGARTARIVEDMLPRGIMRHAQIHVSTNLSNVICLNVMDLRSAKGSARTSAEHRSKICILCVLELKNTWELGSWLLQIFRGRVDGTAGERQRQEDTEANQLAIKSGTPLQASYGAIMTRDIPNFPSNLADLNDVTLNLGNDMMDPMALPVDEMERFLFSQIYNSNPFW